MIARSIYNMFCIKCYSMKDHVREFRSHGNDSIVLFMNDFGRPLMFTVIDFKKELWKLEPFIM